MNNKEIDLSLIDDIVSADEPRQCYSLSTWNAWKFSRLNEIAPQVRAEPILLRKKKLFGRRGKSYAILTNDGFTEQPIIFNDKGMAKRFLNEASRSYNKISRIRTL